MAFNNVEEYPFPTHEVYDDSSSNSPTEEAEDRSRTSSSEAEAGSGSPSTEVEYYDSDEEYYGSDEEVDFRVTESTLLWNFLVFLFSLFWLTVKVVSVYFFVNAVWWHIYQSNLTDAFVNESDCQLYRDTDLLYHLFC